MDVVDAQVHLDFLYRDSNLAEPEQVLRAAVTAMDAIGIGAVLIAEGVPIQGERFANGAVRGHFRFSRRAVELFPRRFGYVVVADAKDPDLEGLVAQTRPGSASAIRFVLRDAADFEKLADGGYEAFFAAAAQQNTPIFILLNGERLALLEPYLRAFPRLRVILDHCGVSHAPADGGGASAAVVAARVAEVDRVLALARYPNLAVKWAHAPGKFSDEPYPFRPAVRQLVRYIEAFGAERLMWGSDFTIVRRQLTWSESLHYLRDSDLLTEEQKKWVLGLSARTILDWAPASRS